MVVYSKIQYFYYLQYNMVYVSVNSTILQTRRSVCYAPILLAPAEGWGPFRALLGAFSPQQGCNVKTLNFKLQKFKICPILCYQEAKFDYSYFIIFFALWFKDSTQKILSHFDQKLSSDGDFSEFLFDFESEKSMSRFYCCSK